MAVKSFLGTYSQRKSLRTFCQKLPHYWPILHKYRRELPVQRILIVSRHRLVNRFLLIISTPHRYLMQSVRYTILVHRVAQQETNCSSYVIFVFYGSKVWYIIRVPLLFRQACWYYWSRELSLLTAKSPIGGITLSKRILSGTLLRRNGKSSPFGGEPIWRHLWSVTHSCWQRVFRCGIYL